MMEVFISGLSFVHLPIIELKSDVDSHHGSRNQSGLWRFSNSVNAAIKATDFTLSLHFTPGLQSTFYTDRANYRYPQLNTYSTVGSDVYPR